jgi:hypothetical protein
LPILRQEYTQFQSRFGVQLLGVIEIGSFAHDEAVSFSDHDLRLIIQCANPLLVLNEHLWTDGISDATTPVDWQDLNQSPGLSFGLTNLAFIECGIQKGCFPLVDHTCLYQGRILLDDTKAIMAFRARYHGLRFSNIVPDYLQQVEWRITSKLPSELGMLTEQLDHHKYAVPSIHTCYRIIRDLANIANYHAHGVYICDSNTLAHYYREHWPWFEPTFQMLRAYKTDEQLRQAVFNDIVQHNSKRLRHIQHCAEATVSLWEQFQPHYR